MKEETKAAVLKMVRKFYVLVILAAVIILFTVLSKGTFLRIPSIINIIRVSVPTVLIAAAVTLLMISGNVDLSVGGILGLTATIFALLMQRGIPFYIGLLLIMILGCILGGLNGFFVTKLNITPVIATLATMSLFQGIGKFLVTKGTDIIKGGMPGNMNYFARGKLFLGLPVAVFITIAFVAVIVVFQKRSTLGKYSVAIGGNPTAAKLSGIDVTKIVWILYALTGAAAALAGVTRASYMQAGDPDSGIGIEVDAIIAVLLGGTSFFGGEGSILKTVTAVYILICLTKGLTMIGMQPFWAMFLKGLVFFAALILDNNISKKR